MGTVLVVDDDDTIRGMLRMILELDGHEVVEAEHGEDALTRINLLLPPDIVTTDLRMPVLGGEGLIERLRSQPGTAAIPIVVVSGYLAAARALRAAGLVEGFVAKPFVAKELAECIRAITGKINSATRTVINNV